MALRSTKYSWFYLHKKNFENQNFGDEKMRSPIGSGIRLAPHQNRKVPANHTIEILSRQTLVHENTLNSIPIKYRGDKDCERVVLIRIEAKEGREFDTYCWWHPEWEGLLLGWSPAC